MSWSELPVALCLAIFSYVSFFAFSKQTTIVIICLSCILSALGFVLLDILTNGIDWSIGKGIPILLVSNVVVMMMILVVRKTVYKGINLIACCFMAAAFLCMAIEAILSLNDKGRLSLYWSLLVTVCLVPVIIVLLFVHIRLKKGRSLEKTFHI
jgi:xanthine/uracil permease